jgi:hypothetical protein
VEREIQSGQHSTFAPAGCFNSKRFYDPKEGIFPKQEEFENRSAVLRMLRAFCFLVNSTHSYHLGISVGDIPDGRYETRQTFRSPITGGTKILFPKNDPF